MSDGRARLLDANGGSPSAALFGRPVTCVGPASQKAFVSWACFTRPLGAFLFGLACV